MTQSAQSSVRVSSIPLFYLLTANLLAASPSLNFRRPSSLSSSAAGFVASSSPPANTIDLYLDSLTITTLPALPDALADAAPLSSVGGLDAELSKAQQHVRALLTPDAVRMRAQLHAPAPGKSFF
jgi:hypothetical protein